MSSRRPGKVGYSDSTLIA